MSSSLGMRNRLAGNTILITGASSGIGRSISREFARTSPDNLKLILAARRVDALNEVAKVIKDEVGDGVKILTVKLDVSKPKEVTEFFANIPEAFQNVNIFVNNAGLVKGIDRAPDIKAEDLEVMLATNLVAGVQMTQEVLSIFNKNGSKGDIIMIGSIAGREGYPGGSIYCATKAALRTFTDALRRELIATRIRVMEVNPGQVETVSCDRESVQPNSISYECI
jgi:3-hydroxy acid dehydrogenase/malonic semialdehyde reductase